MPASVTPLLRPPALHLESGEVAITLDEDLAPAEVAKAAARFKEITGYTLIINTPGGSASDVPAVPDAAVAEPGAAYPVEINLTYRMIDDAFSEVADAWKPYRKGLKSDGMHAYIELAFITPQIGMRQYDRIKQLAKEIGRPIRIKPEPNQIALAEVAVRLVPAEWRMQKQPSVHKGDGVVRIKCLNAPPEEDAQWTELREKFEELTGYRLEK